MRTLSLLLLFLSSSCLGQSIEELIQSAQSQNVQAQLELANRYSTGDQVEQSQSEAFYWYQQAAQNGNSTAASALGHAYLSGEGTKSDTENAIFWLSQAASNGNSDAARLLGKLYEDLKQSPDTLDLAELWYQEASRTNPQAEEDYARVLEAQFNARRAKQVAAIDQLEVAFDTTDIEVSPKAQSIANSQDAQNMTLYGILALLGTSLLVIGWLFRRNQRLSLSSTELDDEAKRKQIKLERELKRKDELLKQQKRQLETLYRHIKKQQAATPKAPSADSTPKDKPLTLACALFGYSPNAIPDEKQVKARYKQLSKIYHPDLKGSDAEMKRLNQALKLILKVINK
ncbi:J domain-containing protein [Vibrio ouci]|uniref:J domain-containing protein n=1 Tax=Vibrio ouci TaxID=2499078 RepID=A0A4Y8WF48_9VIBR|nr:J domain-containing protein [Vibrio ouci]TFH90938.1 J domain-containing protein [Vibrio ouci]